MYKDYDTWNTEKKKVDKNESVVFFHEREIWWCKLGINIGFEQDGKGPDLIRPVVIFKKFNNNIFLGIPLSTSKKQNKYLFPIGNYNDLDQKAILSQIRLIDKKRLVSKIITISKEDFLKLKIEIKKIIFD